MATRDRDPWWRNKYAALALVVVAAILAASSQILSTRNRCFLSRALGFGTRAGCLPDLKPVSMAGARGPEWCQQVTISTDATIVVANIGWADAGASTTQVFVVPNIGAPSTVLQPTPPIPVGGSYTFTVAVPVAMTDFPISVTADVNGQVAELDETNNVRAGTCSR